MITSMKRLASAIALVSLTAPALADPLTVALEHNGGILCFTRSYDAAWLKAHRGQTIREVRFALAYSGDSRDWPMLRMSLRGTGKPIYVYGPCEWWDKDLNRGVQDNVLDPTFKGNRGIGCHMMTDTTGVSAEEGGDFPVAWGDGRYVQVHLGGGATGWRSYDVSRPVSHPDLSPADSIFRLYRAPASECRELVTKFAPRASRRSGVVSSTSAIVESSDSETR